MCSNVALIFAHVIIFTPFSIVSITYSNLDLAHVDDFRVIYPRVFEKALRRRRQVNTNIYFEEVGKLKVIEVGDWHVELNSEGNLLVASNLEAEWISTNGSTKREGLQQCDFKSGVVSGFRTSSIAAVTLCGEEITGFVDVAGVSYFLLPLNGSDGAHALYTSKKNGRRRERSVTNENFSIPPRSIVEDQWLFNLTGDTIDIGNVDIELDQRSEKGTSTGNEGELYIAVAGSNSSYLSETQSSPPAAHVRPSWHKEQLDDEELGYLYDTAWTSTPQIQIHSRVGGSSLPTRWLEIAVAVDHTLVSFHGKSKVGQYILALMNIVSAIYQDPSLEANMKLVVSRLMLYENKKQSVVRPGNAKKSLENVNIWNKRLHMSLGPNDPHHDVAVWLTRSDIGGPSGYAPVAGTCDPKRSCALNRDEGLTSAFIIAHEMAHILGLSHDGDKKASNTCGDEALQGSVMAPMVAATFHKFSWSECSKHEFRSRATKWPCLLNPPSDSAEIELNATLDTSFSMDEQCRMEFGHGYAMCRAFDIIEPCSHLWCGHVGSPLVCKTKKGPPLEGTECGFSKWCVNGYCENVGTSHSGKVPVVLNPQDGGWSEWSPWGTCSRTCGTGVEFKTRKCNNPVPSYGGRNCEGISEEWRICNTTQCPEPLTDIRAEQCRRLPKLLNLIGKPQEKLTWLPYESDQSNKKCKLICKSEETKELYITNENLIDGTPCSYESPGLCVQGECYDVGCDRKLNSQMKTDSCGVCGGNNSDCSNVNSVINRKLKREVSRIAVLPRLAREIKVETNITRFHSDNPAVAFIVKNRRRKKYIVTIPYAHIFTEVIEGARFHYKKFGNKHTIWTRGPLLAEMIVLVYSPLREIERGLNISTASNYTIHKDALIPSKRFVWILGGWGPCSVSCGGGRQQKTTACWDNQNKKLVKRKMCSLLAKPTLETQKCNSFDCNFQWIAGEWEPCSTTCGTSGTQHREIYCVPKSVLNVILYKNNGTILKHPWRYMVNPKKCSGIAPVSERSCNRVPCISFWEFGDWSQCSATCGPGTSTRSAKCPPPANESFFTCGDDIPLLHRECTGFTRHENPLCRGRKKKSCSADQSKYCSLPLLSEYCQLKGFRRLCCKSCAGFHLKPITI